MCSALNWALIDRKITPQFYPETFIETLDSGSVTTVEELKQPYILCFHSTAREAKRWSNDNWISLGKELTSKGYQVVLPWGNAAEKSVSTLLASRIPGAIVPDAFSIEEAFSLIKGAALAVGVDTGLTHLSAVLGRPTVEIYCDSPLWKTEGYWSRNIRNVGDVQNPPKAAEVIDASLNLLL
jgi:heptosyltransferase-1